MSSKDFGVAKLICMCMLALHASSCVIIPYEPSATVTTLPEETPPPRDMLLEAEDNYLVTEVSDEIKKKSESIQVLHAAEFEDVLFPDSDNRVSRFLEPMNLRRIANSLDVGFVILIGDLERTVLDEAGVMPVLIPGGGTVPPLGFWGAGSLERKASLSAVVVDLTSEKDLKHLAASAEGTSAGVGAFYGVFLISLEEKSITKGIAREIVRTLSSLSGTSKLRILLLRLDASDKTRVRQLNKIATLRREFAALGDSGPLSEPASQENLEAAIGLYKLAGDLHPLRTLAEGGNEEAKVVVEAHDAKAERVANHMTTFEPASLTLAEAQYQAYFKVGTRDPLAWLCRAADRNHPDARFRLGILYENGGEGVPQSDIDAAVWYSLASESGHPSGNSNAERIVNSSIEDFVELSRRLRQWNPRQCEIDLGLAGEADERLRKSPEDGDPASNWLLYAHYGYREQDWVWLCKAADQEYGDAMVEVGNILWEGRGGISRDRELARCWYKAAVDAGHGDAKSELMAAEWMLSGDQAASTDDRCTGKHLPSCEETLLSRETP